MQSRLPDRTSPAVDALNEKFAEIFAKLDKLSATYNERTITHLDHTVQKAKQKCQPLSLNLSRAIDTLQSRLISAIESANTEQAYFEALKNDFLLSWKAVLHLEGKDYFFMQRARRELPQELILKQDILDIIQAAACCRNDKRFLHDILSAANRLKSQFNLLKEMANDLSHINFSHTLLNEAEEFYRRTCKHLEENITDDKHELINPSAVLDTQYDKLMQYFKYNVTKEIQETLEKITSIPQELTQTVNGLKLQIKQFLSANNKPLTYQVIEEWENEASRFQHTIMEIQKRYTDQLTSLLAKIPQSDSYIEVDIFQKIAALEEKISYTKNNFSKLKTFREIQDDSLALALSMNNIDNEIKIAIEEINDYNIQLDNERKSLAANRDRYEKNLDDKMAIACAPLEDILFRFQVIFAQLRTDIESREITAPFHYESYNEIQAITHEFQSMTEQTVLATAAIKKEIMGKHDRELSSHQEQIQAKIDHLYQGLHAIEDIPNQILDAEDAKLTKLSSSLLLFKQQVQDSLLAIKRANHIDVSQTINDAFGGLGNFNQELLTLNTHKARFKEKINEITTMQIELESKYCVSIATCLCNFRERYSDVLSSDSATLQQINSRLADSQARLNQLTQHLSNCSLEELDERIKNLDKLRSQFSNLHHDIEIFEQKLSSKKSKCKRAATVIETKEERAVWQSLKSMEATTFNERSLAEKIIFLKVESENYLQHLMEKPSSDPIYKLKLSTLQQLVSNFENQTVYPSHETTIKSFFNLFRSSETIIRSRRDSQFTASIKKILAFIFPFNRVKDKLYHVHGAEFANQIERVASSLPIGMRKPQKKDQELSLENFDDDFLVACKQDEDSTVRVISRIGTDNPNRVAEIASKEPPLYTEENHKGLRGCQDQTSQSNLSVESEKSRSRVLTP